MANGSRRAKLTSRRRSGGAWRSMADRGDFFIFTTETGGFLTIQNWWFNYEKWWFNYQTWWLNYSKLVDLTIQNWWFNYQSWWCSKLMIRYSNKPLLFRTGDLSVQRWDFTHTSMVIFWHRTCGLFGKKWPSLVGCLEHILLMGSNGISWCF